MTGIKLNPEKITGSQKTAVFLLTMGEAYTADFFRNLKDNEIAKVANAMSQIEEIPPDVLSKVMDEFNSIFEDEKRMLIGGENFIRKVLEKALDKETAERISKQIDESRREAPFSWSMNISPATLAGYLAGEHPQTIAMILANLPPLVASDVMMAIPDERKGDVALRLAQLGQVPEEVVRDVDNALKNDIGTMGKGSGKAGGIQVLVDIINNVDKATEDAIMETIEENQAEMAEEIKQMMFVFEDLKNVDDRAMREILKKVESSQLTLAMKTASEEMKQKIVGNLSSRAAEMLMEDLEVMGPVKLSEVEEAQQQIVAAAKDLEADGTITLGGKGAGDILV